MRTLQILCFVIVMGYSSAFPRNGYYPRAYMVGGSFYANPRYVRQGPGYDYIPPGQMTAMVVGDTVATNSFSGPSPSIYTVPKTEIGQVYDDERLEPVTEKQRPILVPVQEPEYINETEPQEEEPTKHDRPEQETLFSLEEATTETVVISTPKATPVGPPKGKKVKTSKAKRPAAASPAPLPVEEDDEEEEADQPATWPFAGAGKAGIPNYNAFFPIFIGGNSPSGRSRARSGEEGGYPGSATAIANAFSTGKGGVATSHATSFGDPYAAAMFRNAGIFRTKSSKKQYFMDEQD